MAKLHFGERIDREATVMVGASALVLDETTEFGYFSRAELETLDVMETHRPRIADSFAGQESAFVR